MKLYLVGGAVRDMLLGREPKDMDFVAVGATEEQLVKAFPQAEKQGAAFPVYRVPGLGEVALARRERKTGPGHKGFAVDFGPEVTLEEDLSRRDLTVNAMAKDMETGKLVDPFDGQEDLNNRVLRHVGPAFVEDPLRVYRVARFSAQLNFNVRGETRALMRDLVHASPFVSPLAEVSVERVVEELRKALRSRSPWRFFEVLQGVDALGVHFEELAALAHVPAGPPQHHAEGDAFVHTMMVLEQAVRLGGNEVERFAALVHDLGKGTTPRDLLPKHHDHESRGVQLVEAMAERLRLPVEFKRAGALASEEHLRVHRFFELRDGKKVDLVLRADRNPLKAEGLALVAEADALGRSPGRATEGAHALRKAAEVVRGVTARSLGLDTQGPSEMVGQKLRQERARAVAEALR